MTSGVDDSGLGRAGGGRPRIGEIPTMVVAQTVKRGSTFIVVYGRRPLKECWAVVGDDGNSSEAADLYVFFL